MEFREILSGYSEVDRVGDFTYVDLREASIIYILATFEYLTHLRHLKVCNSMGSHHLPVSLYGCLC